eukprot:CAMPEP_0185251168 /NCGR_PEP_ID=MMETSP1359-20130426/616_1 /TAXON_ID=552665 /ORGANISM="Bigelowiella longifila, Strain CCMP242" /LENGTH=601 /DNA_ID=CAMNT_0027832953 /DNA_START=316 /DNA_END=2118 /DNA_ORIENTATION=-
MTKDDMLREDRAPGCGDHIFHAKEALLKKQGGGSERVGELTQLEISNLRLLANPNFTKVLKEMMEKNSARAMETEESGRGGEKRKSISGNEHGSKTVRLSEEADKEERKEALIEFLNQTPKLFCDESGRGGEARWEDISAQIYIKDAPERGKFFVVSGLHIAGLRNGPGNGVLRLYGREEAIELWTTLEKERELEIVGAPGLGKSVTTWGWAVSRWIAGKNVLWVHFLRAKPPTVAFLNGETKKAVRVNFVNDGDLNNSNLVANGTLNGSKADIVVLDGLRTDGQEHQALEQSCHFDEERVNIVTKSLAGKEAFGEVRRHAMHPWTLEQYLAASKDEAFRKEVCTFIGCEDEEDEFSEKLREKFYFAGHSARWMFATDLKTVKGQINRMIDKVRNAESLLNGNAGSASVDAINHLVCTLKTPGSVANTQTAFVSKYVLKLLVIKHSFMAVKMGYIIAEKLQNPSFMGWVVEMDFLAQLKAAMKTEDKKVNVCDSKNAPVDWKAHAVHEYETTEDLEKIFKDVNDGRQVWAVPLEWNNAAFDAVRIYRSKGETVLHLINVADAKSHTLKMHHVSTLAQRIGAKRVSFSAVRSTKRINENFTW